MKPRLRKKYGRLSRKSMAEVKQNLAQFQPNPLLETYFKIGISDDYILIRDDFPMTEISPGDFSKLCREMFRRNEEALHNGK